MLRIQKLGLEINPNIQPARFCKKQVGYILRDGGGVKSAISGGDWSPIRDMIGGALSSVGNGYINENVNGLTLKMASSAVLGGTISEIGGGKFANGAITGAYSMLFNDLMHGEDDDNVSVTRRIRSAVGNSETVQRVENSVMSENGAVNIVLEVLDKLKIKAAGTILKVIDGVKFYVDNILPMADKSLKQEYYRKTNVPFTYSPGSKGYMGSDGVWHPNK